MPPPVPRSKADDDDIFGDAGSDYVCALPQVSGLLPSGTCLGAHKWANLAVNPDVVTVVADIVTNVVILLRCCLCTCQI